MFFTVLAYLAFVALGLVLPGLAVQRALGLRVDPALVLPFGAVLTAGAYWLSLAAGAPWLYPLLLGLLATGALLRRGPWARAAGPPLRGALLPCAGMLVFLALCVYPFNRRAAGGEFLSDPLESVDTTFHVGLIWELAQGYPPQVPGLAGAPLHYHLGHPLLRAAALRWAGVRPYDLTHRCDVTLMAIGLVLALRGLLARLHASAWALALIGWTPLLTDGSFLLGALYGGDWWADLLSSNLLLWLAFDNALVPALAILCAVLVALSRQLEGEGRGWLWLALLGVAALPHFKVFLAVQLLAGLAWAGLRTREPRLALLLGVGLLAVGGLVLQDGGRTVEMVLDPLAPLLRTAQSLDLARLTGGRLLGFALVWILLALGARVLGLARLGRAFASRQVLPAALAGAVLAGFLPGLLLRITLAGEGSAYNESTYFLMQSGALLWVFTALAVGQGPRRAWLVAALLLVSLPSTAQFVARRVALQPVRVPAPLVRAMLRLEAESAPGAVVLQPSSARFPPPPLVLAGRRLAYTRYIPYMAQFAAPEWVRARRTLLQEFWGAADAERAVCLAEQLGASYVLLYGPLHPAFEPSGLGEAVYLDEGVELRRLRRPAPLVCARGLPAARSLALPPS